MTRLHLFVQWCGSPGMEVYNIPEHGHADAYLVNSFKHNLLLFSKIDNSRTYCTEGKLLQCIYWPVEDGILIVFSFVLQIHDTESNAVLTSPQMEQFVYNNGTSEFAVQQGLYHLTANNFGYISTGNFSWLMY